MNKIARLLPLLGLMTFAGCAGRAELYPNDDPMLRKTSTAFAADAAKRFPFKANATQGGQAQARCEVGYFLDRVDIVNYSDTEWTDVELWINSSYVVFLPRMEPKLVKSLPFQAIYNDQGASFPTHKGGMFNPSPVMVTKVQLYRDGHLYDVPVSTAE